MYNKYYYYSYSISSTFTPSVTIPLIFFANQDIQKQNKTKHFIDFFANQEIQKQDKQDKDKKKKKTQIDSLITLCKCFFKCIFIFFNYILNIIIFWKLLFYLFFPPISFLFPSLCILPKKSPVYNEKYQQRNHTYWPILLPHCPKVYISCLFSILYALIP